MAAADVIATVVDRHPQAVIGWPTGRTPVPLYEELARRCSTGAADLSLTYAFNLDELLLPADDPRSFAAFMRRHAGERIGLDPERCDIPRGDADPGEECRRYDAAIDAAGGLDLAVLGVGVDGHVAYNLPGPPVAGTHVVEVPDGVADELDVEQAARPLRAITMGLGPIADAARLLVMATGEPKRQAVQALTGGPEDPAWPCSLLREHEDLTLVVDRAAAGRGAGL